MNTINSHNISPTISIIVPVYQVFPYLKECLDSILEQSFTDWEMLLIDDGSTDGSESICDEYGAKDKRIRVFHQSNRGLSAARNTGLDNARGEYITLFDSDDVMLCSDYLQILYDSIIQHNAQVSMCKLISFDDGKQVPEAICSSERYELLSGRDIFVKEPYRDDLQLFSMAVFKLYHKSCFNQIRYPEGRIIEDLSVFHHLFYPLKKIVLLDKYMYGRRFRDGSIVTGTKGSIQYRDTIIAIDDCISYLENKRDSEALFYARRRKKNHMFYYYFKALKDGSLNEIPGDIIPKISDFEDSCSHIKLLTSLRNADPEYKDVRTTDYLSLLCERAFRLLSYSSNYVFNNNVTNNISSQDIDHIYKLADSEGMLAIAQSVFGDNDSQFLNKTIRYYILIQNEWKKIKNHINVNTNCTTPVPLIPTDLLALYPRPWLRNNCLQIFLIDKKDINSIKQIMEDLGYNLVPNDSLESNRNCTINFANKENVKFVFLYDVPFYLPESIRGYLQCLFDELFINKRELSLNEYATLLVLKLHLPNMYSSSANLGDLLDLILIIHSNQSIIANDDFQKNINRYMLEEDWNIIYSICKKISLPDNISKLQENEQKYIKELISRPFLRTSYFHELSSYLCKKNLLLDPVEYTVSREKQLVYLVNSKVACSSIKASIIGDRTSDYNLVHLHAQAKGMSKTKLDENEQSFFKFTFVRNPFTRLVSCYKSKYHTDKDLYDNIFDFQNYLNGYLYFDNGFEEFIKKVCALPYRLMDRHFRLQFSLVYDDNDKCRCDYVGKFENLADDFKSIQEKNHLLPLPHLNKAGTDGWMNYYTIEIATLVYKTFQKDFEIFGYENYYSDLISYLESKNNSK